MKKALLIIAITCLCANGYAQIRIDWQQCYGSMGNDEARGIAEKDDGYWVVGYVKEPNGMVTCHDGSGHAWLIEISSEGDMVEEHCLNNFSASDEGGLSSTFEKENYCIGKAYDTITQKSQINVTKLDSEGEVVWTRNFGNREKSFWLLPNGIATADGGAIANTSTQWSGGDIGNYYGSDDVWVVKVDSLGRLEWETTLGTEDFECQGAISLASDGGYYVSMLGRLGHIGSIAACDSQTMDYYDGVLVKLASDGDICWNRCYAGSYNDQICRTLELDEGLLLLCATQSDDRDAEGAGYHFGYVNGQYWLGRTSDIWLIKTDFDGNILWGKCYGGTQDEYPLKAFQNEDGGFTVFGTTQSLDGDVQSTNNMLPYGNSTLGRKIWMFRTDAEGNLLWERAFGHNTSDPISIGDVIKHNDKEYTIAGTANAIIDPVYQGEYNCSNAPLCGLKSFWVFHVTDIFNYDDPTSVSEEPQEESCEVKVYPNPATTWVAIDYNLPNENSKATIVLYNNLGLEVMREQLNGQQGQKVLDWRGIANGVYFYRVSNGEFEQNGKVVIAK